MVSSDKEQLNQLDRLIQNAGIVNLNFFLLINVYLWVEFETKQQTQAITEERHKIESKIMTLSMILNMNISVPNTFSFTEAT